MEVCLSIEGEVGVPERGCVCLFPCMSDGVAMVIASLKVQIMCVPLYGAETPRKNDMHLLKRQKDEYFKFSAEIWTRLTGVDTG